MGTPFSAFNNKYLSEKFQDDEEPYQTTTEPRNQNVGLSRGIYIERGTPKQIQNESDINGSNTDGQEYLMKQKDLKILALEEQVKNLTAEKESLVISNTGQEYLMKQKDLKILAFEEEVKNLTAEKESLVIRLSQICCVKLSDGSPIMTDLSDPNRAAKVASRFSEVFDNQWSDSFQALCESTCILEENAIQDLLQIVLNVYHICRKYTECQNQELVKAVQSFTGVKEIGKSLQSSVDLEVYKICQDYITECTEVCWLMCVKSPPMYISADKTDTFQQDLYTGYTTFGKYVSYVVWPTLFQYKDGPIMQRGVAQGTNNKM